MRDCMYLKIVSDVCYSVGDSFLCHTKCKTFIHTPIKSALSFPFQNQSLMLNFLLGHEAEFFVFQLISKAIEYVKTTAWYKENVLNCFCFINPSLVDFLKVATLLVDFCTDFSKTIVPGVSSTINEQQCLFVCFKDCR